MYRLAVKAGIAPANVVASGAADFAGENNLVSTAACLQPLAYDDFGMSVGLRADINRVHLGRIKKVDAVLARMIHLRKSFLTSVLLAPGHGAKAKDGYVYVGRAESPELHVDKSVRLWVFAGNLAQ